MPAARGEFKIEMNLCTVCTSQISTSQRVVAQQQYSRFYSSQPFSSCYFNFNFEHMYLLISERWNVRLFDLG